MKKNCGKEEIGGLFGEVKRQWTVFQIREGKNPCNACMVLVTFSCCCLFSCFVLFCFTFILGKCYRANLECPFQVVLLLCFISFLHLE